jgi:2-haloacid dehalogenase
VDTAAIASELEKAFALRAREAAQLWRQTQLEYTFRRGLMGQYVDFDTCTAQALRFVSAHLGVRLDAAAEQALLAAYLRLPAFADVVPGLEKLRRAGHRLLALSNGTEQAVRALLRHAAIDAYFEAVLSVDPIQTFKPDPAVYALLRRAAGTESRQATWLVSANPFDVIGAKAAGVHAAWLRRDASRVFDPWEFAPDATITTLQELAALLQQTRG